MFDQLDGIMQGLAKKKTQWNKGLYFVVRYAQPKLSIYYTEVTQTTSMLFIFAHILHTFQMLQSFLKLDKGMDINPEDETSYSTQYEEAFLKYVKHEYCAKHRRMSVIQLEPVPSTNPFSA